MYEMATGRRPFSSDTALGLMYEVLNVTPPAPRTVKPDLSPRLDAIVLRAIDRDPERRYARAGDLVRDLQALEASAVPDLAGPGGVGGPEGGRSRIESLAVLPLENLSGDAVRKAPRFDALRAKIGLDT